MLDKAENSRRITDHLKNGSVESGKRSLGFELEHIIVRTDTKEAVSYYGDDGVEEILRRLSPHYTKQLCAPNGENVLGLSRSEGPGRESVITLEPGAQLEISTGPFCTIDEIEASYKKFYPELEAALFAGQEIVTLGYQPKAKAREIALIPRDRYESMSEYFESVGEYGICMMRGSASTQISIDYRDEADCIKKVRIATALGPILSLMTDNSPVFEGEVAREHLARTHMWNDVDEDRSGVIPHLFDEGYGFADYADYLLSAPLVFADGDKAGGGERFVGAQSASEVYTQGELSEDEIKHILSMFFFDVRIKSYIEIRVADSMPVEYALAYAALIKGLFYTDENIEKMSRILDELYAAGDVASQIDGAKEALMRDGYDAQVYGRNVGEWASELCAMAFAGLNSVEEGYLQPLCELVQARETLAQRAKRELS